MSSKEFNGFRADHIGASKTRSYEDRSFYGDINTQSGLKLTLAIVADGVGGGNLGERAAELTISTIENSLRRSNLPETEILQMLGKAVGAANRAVYREALHAENKQGMSSTVSIALIHKRKLYVANVGDSRIYLVQNGKAKQITVDHTFAVEKIRSGLLSPERALNHPKADHITRSIGFEPNVLVDLGLYLKESEKGAEALSNQGLLLEKNDVLVVCSDGLIKERLENPDQPYVTDKEIVDTIVQYHAREAAKVMVDLAVGRNVDDNVTAVVVEFTDRKVSNIKKRNRAIISSVLAIILVIVFFILKNTQSQLTAIESEATQQAETAQANTQIALSFTPEPTATQRPPLEAGEIGALIDASGNRQVFKAGGSPIIAQGFSEAHVNHTGEFEDGKIYLQDQSQILFEAEPLNLMSFVAFPNSELFVYPGRYTEGASIRIANAKGTVDFAVVGSCMSIKYENSKVVASCYEGDCSYEINYGGKQPIPLGEQITLDIDNLFIETQGNIPLDQVRAWANVLPRDTHARECVKTLIPTPVPTKKHGGNEDNGTQAP